MNAKNIFYYIFLLIILFIIYYKKETFVDSSIPECDNSISNLNTVVGNVGYFYSNKLPANYNNITISDSIFTNVFNSDNMKGIIVAWYDDINTIPNGWVYCNGATYKDSKGNDVVTPDLRSRSILGASNPQNVNGLTNHNLTPKSVLDISGFEKVTLNVKEAPEHSHWTQVGSTSANWANGSTGNPLPGGVLLDFDGKGCKAEPTNAVGGGKPHNNIPPYMALIYIMKL